MVFPSKKSSFIIQSIESCILRIRIKEKGGGGESEFSEFSFQVIWKTQNSHCVSLHMHAVALELLIPAPVHLLQALANAIIITQIN